MIDYDKYVVLKNEKCYRLVKVNKGPLFINKTKLSFQNAIGQKLGSQFEIRHHQLHKVADSSVSLVDQEDDLNDESDRLTIDSNLCNKISAIDNKLDDNNKISQANVQKLSTQEILDLKAQSVAPEEIITKLMENNVNFEHRTEFSREKYLKKKKKKHCNAFLILEPTIRLLSNIFYTKDTDKICGLRIDNLALILNLSNVACDSKVVVFENCAGLIAAAVLERLNGRGVCIHFHRNEHAQAIPALQAMNFSPEVLSSFYPVSLSNWDTNIKSSEESNLANVDQENALDESQRLKIDRRLANRTKKLQALSTFEENNFTSLIIASKQHPLEFMKKFYAKMEPSSSFVVYSQHITYLLECFKWLREQGNAVNVQLSENFYRRYQVLPGRTHPEMNQLVAGGYILSGIFVEN